MAKSSNYTSKKPDDSGFIAYDSLEDQTWATLYTRQKKITPSYACAAYNSGHELLGLPTDRIPQLNEVSEKLQKITGWSVAPVPALISYNKFFDLLANCRFPAATFIRTPEELDYLQEPDIFHEIYGHCPMLTDPVYANFMAAYGKIGVNATPKQQRLLARLYWFTVEFGLLNTDSGLKAYGAGILSSPGETPYAIESEIPIRKPFNIIEALRTPYRIDIFQTVYFTINSFDELYNLAQADLLSAIEEAESLGEFEPTYPAC